MIDSLDEQLIRLLEQDGWQSSTALAKQAEVSSATVRRRLKRLVDNGVLQLRTFVDPNKIAQPVGAVIALSVPNDKMNKVAHILSRQREIRWVSTTTGRYDIMVFSRFSSTDELANFLQNELPKDSINEAETFICLHTHKGYYVPP